MRKKFLYAFLVRGMVEGDCKAIVKQENILHYAWYNVIKLFIGFELRARKDQSNARKKT
jgi:hypothetical protein